MRFGRFCAATLLATLAWVICLPDSGGPLPSSLQPAAAAEQQVRIVARFVPQEGLIADAALGGDGHLFLLYPDAGQIADYTYDGKLYQHIIREGGRQNRFRPTCCLAASANELLVFDEADHKLFYITADGNFKQGIDLAYPSGADGALLALSRIGDLALTPQQHILALLPERGVLAEFDRQGTHQSDFNLLASLPYPQAVYTRAQELQDGSLFILDYHQGAVLYRRQQGDFRRLMLNPPQDAEAVPGVQDFAADEQGNVLLLLSDKNQPLLLDSSKDGYHSHELNLRLPADSAPLACRQSRGKYIVWSRRVPYVCVLEVR
jgi:hypothetical protein